MLYFQQNMVSITGIITLLRSQLFYCFTSLGSTWGARALDAAAPGTQGKGHWTELGHLVNNDQQS